MVNKIKEKIKNNRILKIVLISFLAIILGVGISYAFYAAIIKGNETSTTLQLDAGTLSINYDGGNVVNAKNFLPNSDEPFATKTFTLTGNNDSDLYMPYTFTLVVDANTFNDANGNIILPGIETNNGRLDMWLQVKLKKELATPIQVDEESKIFALPKYRIKLETETNS